MSVSEEASELLLFRAQFILSLTCLYVRFRKLQIVRSWFERSSREVKYQIMDSVVSQLSTRS